MKVSELLRLLSADGWFLARQRGSHRQLHHPTKAGTVQKAPPPLSRGIIIDVPLAA